MSDSQLKLMAPVSGLVVAIESVPDPVFAQKLVGNGVAIDPTSQLLLAPCAGKIAQLHSSQHAITIATETGAQVLLHIGLDTVQLKGKGFHAKVKLGDQVKAGQPLIEFSADEIVMAGKSLLTMMVVIGDTPIQLLPAKQVTAGKDALIAITSAQTAAATPVAPDKAQTAESREVLTTLPTGMHARPAALLVNLAKTFSSNIEIFTGRGAANAKSVVGIMGLEIGNSEKIRFFAQGSDATSSVKALADFVEAFREAAPAHAPAVKTAARTSTDANVLFGVGVSPGLAIGRIARIHQQTFKIEEAAKTGTAQEKASLRKAIENALAELASLRAQVKAKTDASQAAIFSAHAELLEDPAILDLAITRIDQGKSAAFAWNEAITVHADRLANLNNELMANRANDLVDVGQRVLRGLVPSQSAALPVFKFASILIAENLTPSQTAQLDREKVFAFATVTGGATSHVAILARSLGLPALAGMDAKVLEIPEGTEVIVDGDRGELRLNPSAEEKAVIAGKQKEQLERRNAALAMAQKPAQTRDGKRIEVAANIGNLNDAKEAMEMGADGVGLLRSEFLFLERDTAPSEDEQYAIYQQIADVMPGKPLVIRTLDVGGDKPLQYLPLPVEENPFLGIRGIRVGLLHQDILRTQLRAILRVKSAAKIHIMFPMIATLEEFRQAKAILEDERAKLKAQPVAVGIMVEVPSVALLADAFAKEVDFFSVGTNDLTQYTLAMDRGHKDLAKQADALHPSVLKLIELTCKAAKAHGRWVGVCGGLAGDSKAVNILIGLGVEELSVSIPSVPLIKSQVRENSLPEAIALAEKALAAPTADAVRALSSSEDQGLKKTKGFGNVTSENVVLVPTENR
jgi:phosphoenolpyruvate-protein phosphotransferase